jgi:hypothetical protein
MIIEALAAARGRRSLILLDGGLGPMGCVMMEDAEKRG